MHKKKDEKTIAFVDFSAPSEAEAAVIENDTEIEVDGKSLKMSVGINRKTDPKVKPEISKSLGSVITFYSGLIIFLLALFVLRHLVEDHWRWHSCLAR